MPNIRHQPVAPTRAQLAGRRARASTPTGTTTTRSSTRAAGVLAVTTDAGTWVAPGTRAIWVPAGTVHAHHAHGELDLHLVGLPADDNPLGLDEPTVLTVGPLLRELILAYTRDPARRQPRTRAPARRPARPAAGLAPAAPAPAQPPPRPSCRALCAILHADPADDRTLAALGRQVGASDRTLSRLFSADLGMTFPQWRTQLRLYHALLLLADGTPVTAVAHRCGWSSASAFIDVFRRAFGYTPGTHRGSVDDALDGRTREADPRASL